jgi:CTP:molybdopterin cytidylyltransferase MocA
MHGLILAGGEGTRLAADGVVIPKALVPLAGQPQVVRLVRILRREGCTSVTVLARAGVAERIRQATRRAGLGPIRVEPCLTPSSLHTLVAGLALVPPGPVLCSMVDTVMPSADWHRLVPAIGRGLADGREIMLAVTGYVDDELPLWVRRDSAGSVIWLGREPVSPACITGGVYGLSPAGRRQAVAAVKRGLERMRHFLAWTVETGHRVGTVEIPRIIDLDRRRDLDQATAWLNEVTFDDTPA